MPRTLYREDERDRDREPVQRRPGQPLITPRRDQPRAPTPPVSPPVAPPAAPTVPQESEEQRRQRIVNELENPYRQLPFRAAVEGGTPLQRQERPIEEVEAEVGVLPGGGTPPPEPPPPVNEPSQRQQEALEREIRREQIRERRTARSRNSHIQ